MPTAEESSKVWQQEVSRRSGHALPLAAKTERERKSVVDACGQMSIRERR